MLLVLAWDKARGAQAIPKIAERRATQSWAESNATLRARSQEAAGGVVGSLQPMGRDARRRRLAIRLLSLARDPLQFLNRLLGGVFLCQMVHIPDAKLGVVGGTSSRVC